MLGNQEAFTGSSQEVYVTFNDFMSLPIFFYHTIGVNPYESTSSKSVPSRWLYVNFLLHETNMGFNFGMECLFVVLYYKDADSIVEVCMIVCYVGYILVSQLKTFSVHCTNNAKESITHLKKLWSYEKYYIIIII